MLHIPLYHDRFLCYHKSFTFLRRTCGDLLHIFSKERKDLESHFYFINLPLLSISTKNNFIHTIAEELVIQTNKYNNENYCSVAQRRDFGEVLTPNIALQGRLAFVFTRLSCAKFWNGGIETGKSPVDSNLNPV